MFCLVPPSNLCYWSPFVLCSLYTLCDLQFTSFNLICISFVKRTRFQITPFCGSIRYRAPHDCVRPSHPPSSFPSAFISTILMFVQMKSGGRGIKMALSALFFPPLCNLYVKQRRKSRRTGDESVKQAADH